MAEVSYSDEDRMGLWGQIILLQLENVSTLEIATRLGIARSTLYRWRDDPAFRAFEQEAYRQTRAAAISDLRVAVVEAVRTVREIMTDETLNPKVSQARLAAARLVLEHAGIVKVLGDSPLEALTDAQVDELMLQLGLQRVPEPNTEGAH